MTLQIVMFAYQGVELFGVTAGEAENPEKVLPHAVNNVIWRILIFYIRRADHHHVARAVESANPGRTRSSSSSRRSASRLHRI